MISHSFKENELLTGISILAVLKHTNQLELTKCILIEPLLSYSQVLRFLKNSNTESSQLSFINRSKFILVTNRNTTNNSVSLLLDKTKENDCTEANVRDELMKFRGSSKSNTIHGYIDNICKLSPTVLLHFFRKVDLVSTDIDLFEDIRKKIRIVFSIPLCICKRRYL